MGWLNDHRGFTYYRLLYLSSVSDWMIVMVVHGTQGGMTLYAAPQKMLQHPPACQWIKITERDDTMSGFDFVADTIRVLLPGSQ